MKKIIAMALLTLASASAMAAAPPNYFQAIADYIAQPSYPILSIKTIRNVDGQPDYQPLARCMGCANFLVEGINLTGSQAAFILTAKQAFPGGPVKVEFLRHAN